MGEGTVLLRRSSLGDVVLLGAVTAAVAPPVTVVTAPAWAPVARRLVGVDAVVTWPRDAPARDLALQIPEGRWVDLHGSLRSRLLARAAGRSPARIRKRSVGRRLRILGLPVQRPPVPRLYAEACGVDPALRPWIPLGRAGPRALALLPGASRATKRWSSEGFAAVGRAWSGPVVVLGGPGERALCARIAGRVPGARPVAERGFEATLEALAEVAVAVGNDSGLTHLAGACGIPVVTVFGSTHPDDGFAVHPGAVVERELGCRPCTLHGRSRCPLGDRACLDLPPERVIDAVEALCAG